MAINMSYDAYYQSYNIIGCYLSVIATWTCHPVSAASGMLTVGKRGPD